MYQPWYRDGRRARSASTLSTLLGLLACLLAVCAPHTSTAVAQSDVNIAREAAAIQAVDRNGEGHQAAIAAVARLSTVPPSQIPEVLTAMQGVNPLAANWFRAAVEASRDIDPEAVPMGRLQAFLENHDNDPYARSLAFDLICDQTPGVRDELIGTFRNDPCLELRYLAIGQGIASAADEVENGQEEAALGLYTELLNAARDAGQIDTIAKAMDKLGSPVNLTEHFGFLVDWSYVGPFDNTDKQGFDRVYPPEEDVNLTATYEGKSGEVSWLPLKTEKEQGVVDFNEAIGKEKGAVVYAVTEFVAEQPMTVQVRMGTPNGNKVWVNGEEILSNHVYHAGNSVDQYIGTVELRQGANEILVKLCQNEQTDSWAVDWQFQLRITDDTGQKIEPSER